MDQNSAEQGNSQAQYLLGMICIKDYKKFEEAVYWYKKAAVQGNIEAQFELSGMYFHGVGTKQNYSEAYKWCKLAAERGSIVAQYDLGVYYLKGKGTEKDYKLAVKWFRKAASQGNEAATKALQKLGEKLK